MFFDALPRTADRYQAEVEEAMQQVRDARLPAHLHHVICSSFLLKVPAVRPRLPNGLLGEPSG
jgi:hypothetical protein